MPNIYLSKRCIHVYLSTENQKKNQKKHPLLYKTKPSTYIIPPVQIQNNIRKRKRLVYVNADDENRYESVKCKKKTEKKKRKEKIKYNSPKGLAPAPTHRAEPAANLFLPSPVPPWLHRLIFCTSAEPPCTSYPGHCTDISHTKIRWKFPTPYLRPASPDKNSSARKSIHKQNLGL
jgi:hypothetical protein